MPFQKGRAKTGGKVAGQLTRGTIEFRAIVTQLLSDNASNVPIWLEQVANGHGETKPAPEKALDLLAKLAEYAAPKLARTEVSGEGGGPVKFEIAAPWLKQAIEDRNK
jgi:hypothetical protein